MMASLMALPVLPRFAMAASGNVLRIRDYGDITCLDPGIASNAYDETVNGAVHNKLIAYKP